MPESGSRRRWKGRSGRPSGNTRIFGALQAPTTPWPPAAAKSVALSGKMTLLINCGVRCRSSPATPSAIQNSTNQPTTSSGNIPTALIWYYLYIPRLNAYPTRLAILLLRLNAVQGLSVFVGNSIPEHTVGHRSFACTEICDRPELPGADTGGCIKNAQLLHGTHAGNRNTNLLF